MGRLSNIDNAGRTFNAMNTGTVHIHIDSFYSIGILTYLSYGYFLSVIPVYVKYQYYTPIGSVFTPCPPDSDRAVIICDMGEFK